MTGRLVGQCVLESTGQVLVDRLFVADTWWTRFLGLQFRRELPHGAGLLLTPCSSVHMFWVRFPLHIVFIGADGRVLEVRPDVLPWRVTIPASKVVVAVLELPVSSTLPAIGEILILRSTQGHDTALPLR
jgi:uncharacterized membrane protein (UPF0127 family)